MAKMNLAYQHAWGKGQTDNWINKNIESKTCLMDKLITGIINPAYQQARGKGPTVEIMIKNFDLTALPISKIWTILQP